MPSSAVPTGLWHPDVEGGRGGHDGGGDCRHRRRHCHAGFGLALPPTTARSRPASPHHHRLPNLVASVTAVALMVAIVFSTAAPAVAHPLLPAFRQPGRDGGGVPSVDLARRSPSWFTGVLNKAEEVVPDSVKSMAVDEAKSLGKSALHKMESQGGFVGSAARAVESNANTIKEVASFGQSVGSGAVNGFLGGGIPGVVAGVTGSVLMNSKARNMLESPVKGLLNKMEHQGGVIGWLGHKGRALEDNKYLRGTVKAAAESAQEGGLRGLATGTLAQKGMEIARNGEVRSLAGAALDSASGGGGIKGIASNFMRSGAVTSLAQNAARSALETESRKGGLLGTASRMTLSTAGNPLVQSLIQNPTVKELAGSSMRRLGSSKFAQSGRQRMGRVASRVTSRIGSRSGYGSGSRQSRSRSGYNSGSRQSRSRSGYSSGSRQSRSRSGSSSGYRQSRSSSS
ncbi:hypothetical protein HK405_010148, partial [Cladochytrium tenue]